MPKKFIKRFTPKPETLKAHRHLRHLGEILDKPGLWHLSRRSAAGAVAIGFFCACTPIPFQMVLAALLAILFRAHLPLSVSLVWLSNPLTMGPIFYAAYKIGCFVLQVPEIDFTFELSFTWLISTFEDIAPALFLGSFILGLISAFIGYFASLFLWKLKVGSQWKSRRKTTGKEQITDGE